jgi:hypothetical protein
MILVTGTFSSMFPAEYPHKCRDVEFFRGYLTAAVLLKVQKVDRVILESSNQDSGSLRDDPYASNGAAAPAVKAG